jgi:hypothetical protein
MRSSTLIPATFFPSAAQATDRGRRRCRCARGTHSMICVSDVHIVEGRHANPHNPSHLVGTTSTQSIGSMPLFEFGNQCSFLASASCGS